MTHNKLLIYTWLTLLGLTLVSVFLAETADFSAVSAVFICFIVAIKGQLVIDNLIGLRHANVAIRRVMLSYFYILPLLIALGVLFPQVIVDMTTLG